MTAVCYDTAVGVMRYIESGGQFDDGLIDALIEYVNDNGASAEQLVRDIQEILPEDSGFVSTTLYSAMSEDAPDSVLRLAADFDMRMDVLRAKRCHDRSIHREAAHRSLFLTFDR